MFMYDRILTIQYRVVDFPGSANNLVIRIVKLF